MAGGDLRPEVTFLFPQARSAPHPQEDASMKRLLMLFALCPRAKSSVFEISKSWNSLFTRETRFQRIIDFIQFERLFNKEIRTQITRMLPVIPITIR